MLLGYVNPGAHTYTVAGTGASFLSDIRLGSGQTAEETAIQWLSADPAATADYLMLRDEWATPSRQRLVGLLGLSCPEGTMIELRGLTSDWASSVQLAAAKPARRMADGSIAIWWVLSNTSTLVKGVEARIYNERNSTTWANDETVLRVGEFVTLGGAWVSAKVGYKRSRKSMSTRQRTLAGGVLEVARPSYREMTAELNDADRNLVRNHGLENGDDWEGLEFALTTAGNRCAAVVCEDDEQEIHRTAIYGVGDIQEISHSGGRYYTASITIAEIPPDQSSTI